MTLAEFVKTKRKAKGMSQAALASKAGVDGQTISNLETGVTKTVKLKNLGPIALALGVGVEDLVILANTLDPDSNIDAATLQPIEANIPLFDLDVAAGPWADLPEGVEGTTQITDPCTIDQGLFRIRIRGDSMEPRWKDGEVVEFRVFRYDREPWPVGEDVCVCTSDGRATFKRLERVDEDTLTLLPLNKKYKRLTVAKQEVARVALAVGIVMLRPK